MKNESALEEDGMFRWPEKLTTVVLAYGLVFVGFPVLCYLSYLWVTGTL